MSKKGYVITFRDFFDAVKHWWKVILLITAVFAALGFAVGPFLSHQGSASAKGSADTLPRVDFSVLPENTAYYPNVEKALSDCCRDAITYGETLLSDRSVTLEQRKEMEAPMTALANFQSDTLQFLLKTRVIPQIYVPESLLEHTTRHLELSLAVYQRQLISSSAAYELLQSMDAPDVASDSALSSYDALIQSAAQYSVLLGCIAETEAALDQLNNHRNEVITDIRAYEEQLHCAEAELGTLQDDLVACAARICKENALELKVDPKALNTFSPAVYHTHTEAVPEDAAAILVLFSALTGLCVGVFTAVCIEAKKRKESAAF